MDITLTTWIVVPLLGAAIGYITNRIAVKMIFRPIEPINVLGIRVQGLMPRRQKDLAESIGKVVGDHLVHRDDIVQSLKKVDLGALLQSVLDKGLAPKIDALRNLPLIGGFLTDERIDEIKQALIDGILSQRESIYEKLEQAVEKGLDIEQLVAEKVAAFPMTKLEAIVLQIASRELRAIEILGGVLGLLIGIGQVLVITLLS